MSTTTIPVAPDLGVLDPESSGEQLYETIDGQLVEMPPMSAYAGIITARLAEHLIVYNHQRSPKLGRVFQEFLFQLALKEKSSRNRRPDLAFLSFERAPKERLPFSRENAWAVIPDMAVEVISPNDPAEDQLQKILEYFEAGVRLVWVIYPMQGHLYVYHSSTRVEILTRAEILEGGDVIPGFELPLDQLFDDLLPPPAKD
jgi:Uma2 family endonuclease